MRKIEVLWNEGDLAMQMRCNAVQAEAKKLGLENELLPLGSPGNDVLGEAGAGAQPQRRAMLGHDQQLLR